MKSLGSKGKPDFAKLSEAYGAETEEGAETAHRSKQLGKAATEVGAACPPKAGASSFGPTGRQALQKRSRNVCEALRAAVRGEDKEASALALGDRLVRMGTDMGTALTMARSALRVRATHEKQAADELARKLQAFADKDGKQRLDELRAQIPGLPTEGLAAIPSPPGLVCVECAPSLGPMVAKAVAWAITSQETNCTAGLRSHWEQIHRPVIGGDSSAEPAAPEDTKKCRLAGMCLCSAEGKALQTLRDNFIAATKKAFPTSSALRQDLVAGHIVAKIVGSPVDEESDEFLDLDEPIRTVLVHVGRVRLSPFRLFCLLMKQDTGADVQPSGGGIEHVQVVCLLAKFAMSTCISGFVFLSRDTQNNAFRARKFSRERVLMPHRSMLYTRIICEAGYACKMSGAFASPGGW